jgi:hypothetical protein
VAEDDVEETIVRLHKALFECDTQELTSRFHRKEQISR